MLALTKLAPVRRLVRVLQHNWLVAEVGGILVIPSAGASLGVSRDNSKDYRVVL
jgi:hypothetical protein